MTVIYSNFSDSDTYLLRGIWDGLDAKIIELTLDERYLNRSESYEWFQLSIDFSKEENKEVDEAIESEEDTLIVCGHGSEEGCFSPHFNYTVSSLNKDKIKAKRFIGIWCNASTFAKKNNIPGFFSSMFISNTDEADFMVIENVEEERIKESERKFVKTLNSLLRNNVPMEKWKGVFTSIIDTTNEVEVFNFTSLEYFE